MMITHAAARCGDERGTLERVQMMSNWLPRQLTETVVGQKCANDTANCLLRPTASAIAWVHRRRAQRIGGLERMPPLDAALTVATPPDVDVESTDDRLHRRQIFLDIVPRCACRALDRHRRDRPAAAGRRVSHGPPPGRIAVLGAHRRDPVCVPDGVLVASAPPSRTGQPGARRRDALPPIRPSGE